MDLMDVQPGRLAYGGADGTAVAFAAFFLAHGECAGEIVEFRVEDAVACWCPRCDEVGAFGPAG